MVLDLARAPPMIVTNVASGRFIQPQFNPTQFEEVLEVNWNRIIVPGLSHQPLQYIHTANEGFTFDLFSRAIGAGILAFEKMKSDRKFLQALAYPTRGGENVLGGAPPRVLFTWPQVVTIETVLRSLRFRYTQFNEEGHPSEWTASVTLEEIRDVRLFSEDVEQLGTQRSGRSQGS